MHLVLPDRSTLSLDHPVIVGILNVTPDSFSDGGAFVDVERAVEHARRMVADGADVIDIGGESTRPGAERVSADEQLHRVRPVIERLRRETAVPLAIDTTRSEVARAAIDAGVSILNDVSAGRDDPAILNLAAERGTPIVLMHMRGDPTTMQDDPTYEDVVEEVRAFLLERAAVAESHGVPRGQIVLDPGIGFGKTAGHNWALLARLDRFVDTGYPVMLGASRKRFLGLLVGEQAPSNRDAATAAVTALAVAARVRMVRVHEARANRHAADVAFAAASARMSAST